jgi:GAF domain-containing protein
MKRPSPEEFAAIARLLCSAAGVDATLDRIVSLAVRSLGCEYAGVSYASLRGKGIETGAASDEVVCLADAAQREVAEGPCLQAMGDGSSYLVQDTVTDPRWPRWSARVESLGLRSVIGVRLHEAGETLGALTLYSAAPQTFTAADVEIAEVYAVHAASALGRSRQELHLRRAIDSRHLVGLAQGILMERFGIDEDGAFAVLRRYSQERNTKLRVVAEQLIETRTLPGHGEASTVAGDLSAQLVPPRQG